MLIGDRLQLAYFTGPAPQMDCQDSSGARSNQPLDLVRIYVVGRWIDIAENRSDLLPLQGVNGRYKGKRRHDNLAFQLERANRDFQGDCRIAHCYAMLHPSGAGDALFELLDERTAIRQPMGVQHGINSLEQPRPVSDIRTANVNLVGESRRAAEKSEFILHIVNSGLIVEAGAWSQNPWLSIPARF